MKWTNKGHELDEIGNEYVKIQNLYIWGAGKNGKKCYDFLQWLKEASDFTIKFIDTNECKQDNLYMNVEVISPEQFFTRIQDNNVNESSAVVVTPFEGNQDIFDVLYKHNVKHCFNWIQLNHRQTNNFIQHFICVWLLYKYDKLISHWMDYVTTTKCNLNCKGCVNFNEYIKNPVDISFDEFKKHIDIVFEKYDYLYSFHFTGGEPFLNTCFSEQLQYICNTYGNKIYDVFTITNGTIIPNPYVLQVLKDTNCWVQIDNYTETVPLAAKNFPILKQVLDNNNIRHDEVNAEFWYDLALGKTNNTMMSDEELMQWRNDCDIYLQTFKDGKIYSCCRTAYAQTAGIAKETDNDVLYMPTSTKMEILEFRLGYTVKGYVDFCKHCCGVGDNSIKIKPAVQIQKKIKS